MKRRTFLQQTAGVAALATLSGFKLPEGKTHFLSLSFDDGFKKSFYRIAKIHEEYGLRACLNVIATGHLKDFNTEPQWIPQKILGDFDDWNKLREKGHEIMPHTWKHLNLTQIETEQAKDNIERCLTYFEENLDGYTNEKAVYNFAYNASTTELEDFALTKVRAIRTGGWLVLKNEKLNAFSTSESSGRLGCWGHGPDFCDDYVEQEINQFLETDGGWLILNLHGVDKEGWGPIRSVSLDQLLKRLVRIQKLEVVPTGEFIGRAG